MATLPVIIDAKGARRGGREAEQAINGVKKSARQADAALLQFSKSLIITSSVAIFTTGLAKATQASILFADALAEVSTLLDDTPGQLEQISAAAKAQAIAFGSLPVEQTKAFYQIISAGAENATEATNTLTAANKLAVGGVTSVTIAADGLTSAWNVYKNQVESVTELSDALFVGMKAGKTTIGELSAGIGKVAPLAEKAGVSFDALIASVAALTKGGISTIESITGLRAVIAAILKPSQEAVKESKNLGIEFNAAGLQAKGLAGFLSELEEKTKGNTETIAKLFGGVEALVPVLGLSGEGAKNFSEILVSMNKKLGATEEAFKKISKAPGFASKQLRALAAVVGVNLGDAISNVLVPGLRFIVEEFDNIAKGSAIVGSALLVAFGPQIIALIGTQLVTALALATTGVNMLTAAIAANPLGFFAVLITAATSALILFGDQIKLTEDGTITLQDVFVTAWDYMSQSVSEALNYWKGLWTDSIKLFEVLFTGSVKTVDVTMNDIGDSVKSRLNVVVGLFLASLTVIYDNFGLLPDFFSSMMVKATNAIISGIESVINYVTNITAKILANVSTTLVDLLNLAIKAKNLIPGSTQVDLLIVPKFEENEFKFQLGRIEDQAEGTASRIGENIKATFKKAFETDFIGNFVKDFKAAVNETARIRKEIENTKPELPEPPKPVVKEVKEIKEIKEVKGLTFGAGFEDRLEEMVKASKNAAVEMGEAFADVFGTGGTLQQGFADSAAAAIVFQEDLGESLANLGKQIAAQLISKFIQTQLAMLMTADIGSLMAKKTAVSIIAGDDAVTVNSVKNQTVTATSTAATNAKIASSAAPAAALETLATGGTSAALGAIAFGVAMTAILALVARANGLVKFADGGVFTNQVVDRPTIFPLGQMGEAGPEAIMPLTRGASGQLGVLAMTPPGGGQTVFAPVVQVNINKVDGDKAEEAGGEIGRQVNQQLEAKFQEFLRNQKRPGGQLNRQREF